MGHALRSASAGALLLAALALGRAARADEPAAPAPRIEAGPCVAALLDVQRLAEALRIEGAAAGAADADLLRLACRGSTIEVSVGGREPIAVVLDDVARDDRPRVVALAVAERPEPAAIAPSESAPPTPAAAPAPPARASATPARARAAPAAAARVEHREERAALEPWRGWTLGATIEGLGLPAAGGGAYLIGPRVLASRWGRALGAHLGAGVLAGSGGGSAVRLAVANVRFALAGPAVGAGRLDVELGVEGGATWARIAETGTLDQKLLAILSADLVLRLPLSGTWGLSFDLGYRRAYAGDIADLVALGVGVVRAVD